jgi:hypothetical protein
LGQAKPASKPGETPGSTTNAPETYADFTLPEGITPDAKVLDTFKTLAKEAGLSQETAQKFVTWDAERTKASVEALTQAAQQQMTKLAEEMTSKTREVLGADFDKEIGLAASAMDRFGGPELRKLLNDNIIGNHHVLIKAWAAVGKAIAEAKNFDGGGAPGARSEEDHLRTQFPSMFNADGTRKPEFRKK